MHCGRPLIQSAPIRGLSSTRHSRAEAPKSPILRRLRDAVRVDPKMTAADRRKLSRHRIWCGEARTGLVSKLRRRLMSLEAGSRVGASPKTPDGYARNHRDGPKATRGVTYMTIWHTTIARFAPYPPFWVCLHTAHDIGGNLDIGPRLSRQASAPALEPALAGS